MAALTILDEGHISNKNMKGSWAGAMGQNQFMPTSFLSYAVDGDGDGKKDIWQNQADVFRLWPITYKKKVGMMSLLGGARGSYPKTLRNL